MLNTYIYLKILHKCEEIFKKKLHAQRYFLKIILKRENDENLIVEKISEELQCFMNLLKREKLEIGENGGNRKKAVFCTIIYLNVFHKEFRFCYSSVI